MTVRAAQADAPSFTGRPFSFIRPCRAMNGTIDAAAAEQRRIGGVDDRVDVKRGDVSDNDLKPRR